MLILAISGVTLLKSRLWLRSVGVQLPPPIEILIASYGTTDIIIGLGNGLSIAHSLRDSAGESLLATGARVFFANWERSEERAARAKIS